MRLRTVYTGAPDVNQELWECTGLLGMIPIVGGSPSDEIDASLERHLCFPVRIRVVYKLHPNAPASHYGGGLSVVTRWGTPTGQGSSRAFQKGQASDDLAFALSLASIYSGNR